MFRRIKFPHFLARSVGAAAACLGVFWAAASFSQHPAGTTWRTEGFEAFRQGGFDASGANLYVSKKGVLQTIHRFDVNNDGFYDIIFNNNHDMVHVPPSYRYEFANQRQFPQRFEYPGAGAVRMRAADLNGDGIPDLVIARGFDRDSYDLNSWIYWGTPSGWTERQHMELPTPNVRDACVGDLNHDGHIDLAFIANNKVGVSTSLIYWGGKDGYFFRRRTGFETPQANGCLEADLDGDGFLDLVVTAGGHSSRVFWGGASGLDFQNPTALPVEGAGGASLLGRRLVVDTADGIKILGVKQRSFTVDQTIAFKGFPPQVGYFSDVGRIAVADLNHDGVWDIVATRATEGLNRETTSRIFWGRSRGSNEVFAPTDHTDLRTIGAVDVAIGDVDGDGFPDIVFANQRTYLSFDVPSYIYWGGPDGYSEGKRSELPTHGVNSVTIAGHDVLFANGVSGGPIGDVDSYIYFGDEQGHYSPQHMQRLPTIDGYQACVSDFNDDGYVDLFLMNQKDRDTENPIGNFIYWGDKAGLSIARRSEIPSGGTIGCAVADVDRDGYLDLAFAEMNTNQALIYYGSPKGLGAGRRLQLSVKDPRFPAFADLNKDGYLDLLITSIGDDGIYIFWGSANGYSQKNSSFLPAIGPLSMDLADLNGDGYLDIVVGNLGDLKNGIIHGCNAYIYWGSPNGYSTFNRTEIPSLGTHNETIGDFNRDGFLDIFVANYQDEHSRDLNSYIYWGNRDANYTVGHRQALHVGSGAGVVSSDFNGDGWIDLAVSNHVQGGDHHTESLIFWNGPDGFDERRVTKLPTLGPHMMLGVDQGNIYTRAFRELYSSAPYDCGNPFEPTALAWDGATPFGSRLGFEIRGAASSEGLSSAPWKILGLHSDAEKELPMDGLSPERWWQYRVTLADGRASSPTLTRVQVNFRTD